MRVLVFTSLFPSRAWSTQWVYHVNAVKALAEFCDVTVVAPINWKRRLRHFSLLSGRTVEHLAQIPVYHPTVWDVPGVRGFHGTAMDWSVAGLVRQLAEEQSFDAVLGIWAYPDAYVAGLIAKRLDCPLVANVIGSDVNELPNRPAMRARVKTALDSADTVIALSNALRQRVIDLGIEPTKVIVQYNGVDGSRFTIRSKAEARGQLGLNGAPLVCYVGNLLPEKGPDVLVRAFKELDELMPGQHPQIAMLGDGPMMPHLQQMLRAIGAGDRVRLLGRRPNDEIAAWISAADAVCLPSLREGCPNVVLEALASGRPVVASQVGGVPELLGRDNGVMVPPGDPGHLGRALADVMRRSWSPNHLRSTVPCISWREFGAGFHRALQSAVARAARLSA